MATRPEAAPGQAPKAQRREWEKRAWVREKVKAHPKAIVTHAVISGTHPAIAHIGKVRERVSPLGANVGRMEEQDEYKR